MSTGSWKLVWLGSEVGDLGDLVIVSEIKEAQAGWWAFLPGDLEFLVAEGLVDDISHEGLRILLREEGVTLQRLKIRKCSKAA
jgi:hypothetical protein